VAEGPSSDDEMEAIEQRIFENMTALGVSDECVGGAPGWREPKRIPTATDQLAGSTSHDQHPCDIPRPM